MPVRKRDAENTLVLTSTAEVNWTRLFYIIDTLVLDGSNAVDEKIKTVTSTLVLIDTLSQNQLIESASNSLELTQDTSYISAIKLSVSNSLLLQHSVNSSSHHRNAENVLDLQQTVEFKIPSDYSASHNISDCWWTDEELSNLTVEELAAICVDRGLRQSVEVRRSLTNLSITSYLQLQQSAVKSLALQVGNHIHFQHSAVTIAAYESIQSNLSLSQSLSYDKTTLVTSTLDLTQTVDPDATFNRSLSHSLELIQYAVIYDESILSPSPEFTAPVLVASGNVTLTYPFGAPLTSVVLRSPEFDNVEQLEFQRINRRIRGGDLIIHRQAYWPIAERLSMKFTNLTHTVGDSVLDFLSATIGLEIGLLDHEGRQWRGIILTPSARLSADTGRECQYSIALEFEGTVSEGSEYLFADLSGTGLMTGVLT